MLGPLLRLGDKNLSKRVLATLTDDQYADLLSGVLMLHNKLLHVEQLSFDPRFDEAVRHIEPKRLARALEAAVSDENMELFDRLLLPGLPLDYEHSDDMPPLHWACYRENMPMIDKLLAAGASPNYSHRQYQGSA